APCVCCRSFRLPSIAITSLKRSAGRLRTRRLARAAFDVDPVDVQLAGRSIESDAQNGLARLDGDGNDGHLSFPTFGFGPLVENRVVDIASGLVVEMNHECGPLCQ